VTAGGADRIEVRIARVLTGGAVVSVVLLGVGVALMVASGIDPGATTFPTFDPGRLVGDLVALRPEGFLYAGIIVVVATPIARVLGELVGFSLRGERAMAAVAVAILVVIGLSVVVVAVVEG
jgi:uncharacterized membrane protein